MERYDVYLYDLPKVKDGEAVPTRPSSAQDFTRLAEAQHFAAAHKDEFDRIVVIRTLDDEQKLVERFIDGEHIVPDGDATRGTP